MELSQCGLDLGRIWDVKAIWDPLDSPGQNYGGSHTAAHLMKPINEQCWLGRPLCTHQMSSGGINLLADAWSRFESDCIN